MHPLPGKLSQRNEADTFLGASAVAMEGVLDLETAEALTCREGLALANDLMVQKVQIATDCADVVKNMCGRGMSPHGHIIREIKAEMASFTLMDVVYESRNSNVDAHRLAKSSIYESVGWHVLAVISTNGVCTKYSDI